MEYIIIISFSVLIGYLFGKFEGESHEDALDKALKREQKLLSDIEELKRYTREYRYTFEEIDPTILEDKLELIIYDADGRRINDSLELDVGEV